MATDLEVLGRHFAPKTNVDRTLTTNIECKVLRCTHCFTAISRKVVGKNVHRTIPKRNMGYYLFFSQYTVPDTVAVEPTFVAFLKQSNIRAWPLAPFS